MAHSKTGSDSVGWKIRERRKEIKMTQEDLAERVDISPTYLSEIENGRKQAGREVLFSISEILGISLDYLVFDRKEHSGMIRQAEWRILLEDCSGYEQKVLFELARSAKGILRDSRSLFDRK